MRLTADEKRAHVEAFKASGLNRSEYARVHGLPRTTFEGWVKGTGINGRSPHPKKREFFSLLAEGFTRYKAAVILSVDWRTARDWTRKL
jgi:transposase-like protein